MPKQVGAQQRRADVAETRVAQPSVDGLSAVLIDQAQQEPDHRAKRESWLA
jgi:hypothetical protein